MPSDPSWRCPRSNSEADRGVGDSADTANHRSKPTIIPSDGIASEVSNGLDSSQPIQSVGRAGHLTPAPDDRRQNEGLTCATEAYKAKKGSMPVTRSRRSTCQCVDCRKWRWWRMIGVPVSARQSQSNGLAQYPPPHHHPLNAFKR